MIFEDLEIPNLPIVMRERKAGYRRWSASQYCDKKARLTLRQALFYRNLIDMARQLGSNELPVDFETSSHAELYLDHGCVKIAVHSGFLLPLFDDESGVVSSVRLSWDAMGVREVAD